MSLRNIEKESRIQHSRGLLVSCIPDTGASQTIVSAEIARDAKLLIRPTRTELRNASGSIMDLLGEADAVLCNEKHSATSTVLVARQINHSAFISWMDLQFFL